MRKLILLSIFILLFFNHSFAGENHFKIGFGFDYDNSVAKLQEFSSSKNSVPDDITDSDIDRYNDQFKFNNQIYSTGLNFSYSFFENYRVYISAGISFIQHESYFREEDILESSFNNSKPGYFAGLGFEYKRELTEKISFRFSPEIQFNNYPELNHVNPVIGGSNLANAELKHSIVKYDIPVIFQYDFGLFKPGLGVCYYDYFQKVDYKGSLVDDFGDEFLIDRNYNFSQNTNFAGIIYLEFQLNEFNSVFLQSRISENISAEISFLFSI